jgi:hypothetical protein
MPVDELPLVMFAAVDVSHPKLHRLPQSVDGGFA